MEESMEVWGNWWFLVRVIAVKFFRYLFIYNLWCTIICHFMNMNYFFYSILSLSYISCNPGTDGFLQKMYILYRWRNQNLSLLYFFSVTNTHDCFYIKIYIIGLFIYNLWCTIICHFMNMNYFFYSILSLSYISFWHLFSVYKLLSNTALYSIILSLFVFTVKIW
jgi:hypothetical protein